MNELCDAWNEIKKRIIEKTRVIFCKPRQIWWCSIGINIGTEIYGKNGLFERPVLILKMYNSSTALIAPLTSNESEKEYSHLLRFNDQVSHVLLSQIRTVSTKRFTRKIRNLDEVEFAAILIKFKDSI